MSKQKTIIMRVISLLCVFFLSVHSLKAQNRVVNNLYGKWNVSNWIILNTTQQTKGEKKEFDKQHQKCLKSIFTIDSLIENNCSCCEFSLCEKPFAAGMKIKELPIVKDNANTMRYPGNEIEDSNFVGKTFIRLLDKNYTNDKITVIETACQSSLRICVINKFKIALFSGEDLIILSKKRCNVSD